jgi:hypothetical protein
MLSSWRGKQYSTNVSSKSLLQNYSAKNDCLEKSIFLLCVRESVIRSLHSPRVNGDIKECASFIGFEVLTAVTVKCEVFWVVPLPEQSQNYTALQPTRLHTASSAVFVETISDLWQNDAMVTSARSAVTVPQLAVLYSTDPECEDMFENGNYRRRRRRNRPYHSTAPYTKALYGDATGFRSSAHHHHHQLPLGTRNLFGAPSTYPPPYTRYDPR